MSKRRCPWSFRWGEATDEPRLIVAMCAPVAWRLPMNRCIRERGQLVRLTKIHVPKRLKTLNMGPLPEHATDRCQTGDAPASRFGSPNPDAGASTVWQRDLVAAALGVRWCYGHGSFSRTSLTCTVWMHRIDPVGRGYRRAGKEHCTHGSRVRSPHRTFTWSLNFLQTAFCPGQAFAPGLQFVLQLFLANFREQLSQGRPLRHSQIEQVAPIDQRRLNVRPRRKQD